MMCSPAGQPVTVAVHMRKKAWLGGGVECVCMWGGGGEFGAAGWGCDDQQSLILQIHWQDHAGRRELVTILDQIRGFCIHHNY